MELKLGCQVLEAELPTYTARTEVFLGGPTLSLSSHERINVAHVGPY